MHTHAKQGAANRRESGEARTCEQCVIACVWLPSFMLQTAKLRWHGSLAYEQRISLAMHRSAA
eukprot:490427-Pleurochrysis_carterae.AAC.1